MKKKIIKKKKIIVKENKQPQVEDNWDDLFSEFQPDDWKKEWQDMPEFMQEDLMPWRTIYVHFEDQEDLDKFAKLVGCEFTDKTKYIWFPIIESMKLKGCRWIDES